MGKLKCIFAPLLAAMLAGCASTEASKRAQHGARYADPNAIVAGEPGVATMYDLESAALELMEQMCSSPRFSEEYAHATNIMRQTKSAKRRPMIVVAFLENRTTQRVQGRLDAIRDTISTSLFNSGLFDVKDDEATSKILSRIVWGVDGGMEKSSLLQTIGEREAPDFMLTGELRQFEDAGGVHTYRLALAIHSFRTCATIWQGVHTRVKL